MFIEARSYADVAKDKDRTLEQEYFIHTAKSESNLGRYNVTEDSLKTVPIKDLQLANHNLSLMWPKKGVSNEAHLDLIATKMVAEKHDKKEITQVLNAVSKILNHVDRSLNDENENADLYSQNENARFE